jgi:hypothetical protein
MNNATGTRTHIAQHAALASGYTATTSTFDACLPETKEKLSQLGELTKTAAAYTFEYDETVAAPVEEIKKGCLVVFSDHVPLALREEFCREPMEVLGVVESDHDTILTASTAFDGGVQFHPEYNSGLPAYTELVLGSYTANRVIVCKRHHIRLAPVATPPQPS